MAWREAALEGTTAAPLRRDGPGARERKLDVEIGALRDALTRSAVQVEPLQRELGIPARGPSPRRSLRQ